MADADLSACLEAKRSLVENRLGELLSARDGAPHGLIEAMRYSAMASGKRLRPLLVILAAEACGGRDIAALGAACAVEMVHVYSLIHDDLPAMDDDDLRRGQPTCHKQFGEAMAILAGDGLLTLAFQTLAESYPPTTAAACCLELARGAGAAGMVGGQVEDLAWERGHEFGNRRHPAASHNLEALENIHARKTGALFRACLRLGVLVAQGERPGGPDAVAMDCLDAYGRCFGLAFQITDDLLDVGSSADQAGKRVQKDAGRGKLTYPSFLGVEESRRRAGDLCREADEHLGVLGPAGRPLAAFAHLILDRSR